MPDRYDIVVRRVRLRGRPDRLFEIGISDGRITVIEQRADGTAASAINARGNLVIESFVNSHLHLCKVWTR
jgi:cytosine/creatinine deaminase